MTSLDDKVREFQYNQCMEPSRDSWVRQHGLDKIFHPRVKSQGRYNTLHKQIHQLSYLDLYH